ncbi:MAG: DUF4365 domain-containing protein [Bacteroidetes bacterium]|nr:DUF4365 domain-containing protein [Bacteroidota bacterium]
MPRYQWESLNKQQVGAYTEYFVKMELTMYGFQVYETEVDDRGIDFVTRFKQCPFIEVQVKSLRSLGYVFMQKTKFQLHEHMYLALGLLMEGQAPKLFFVPSIVWRSPNDVFVERNYEGLKSKPEWGLNISKKNMPTLEKYAFETTLDRLIYEADG